MSQSSFSLRSRIWYAELFGHVRIDYGTHPVAFRSRAASHLIAYLLAHPRHEESRERILALFWPDARQDDAANNFRVTLSRLRSGMLAYSDRIPVEVTPTSVRIDPTPFFCDLTEFDKALAAARAETEVERRVRHLQKAVGYYKDTLMADCDYDWVRQWRNDREDKYLAALGELFEDAVAKGRRADAVGYAHKILAGDPYDERTARWLEEQRHGRPAAHANRTEAQAPVQTEIPIENEDPDHVLLEELGRWLDDTGAQTPFVVELEGQQFHVRYAKAVAMAVAALEQRDGAQDWETSLETHTTCFRIGPDEDKVLTIRPSRGNPCFAPTGNHAPFYHDPDPTDDLAEALAAETYAYRKAVRAVVAAANKAQAKNQDPNHIARNARGQLTNVLAGTYRNNSESITEFLEKQISISKPELDSKEKEISQTPDISIAAQIYLRGSDEFIPIEIVSIVEKNAARKITSTNSNLIQFRNISGQDYIRYPHEKRNLPLRRTNQSLLATTLLFLDLGNEDKPISTALDFITKIKFKASITEFSFNPSENDWEKAITNTRKILDTGREFDSPEDFIQCISLQANLKNASLFQLVSIYVCIISIAPGHFCLSNIFKAMRNHGDDGKLLSEIATALSYQKQNCQPAPNAEEMENAISKLKWDAYRAFFRINFAITHAFFGDPKRAEQLVKLTSAQNETSDATLHAAEIFIIGKLNEAEGNHRDAIRHYKRAADSLSSMAERRLSFHVMHHLHRCEITLGIASALECYEHLNKVYSLGVENLLIGGFINTILCTTDTSQRSILMGILQKKIQAFEERTFQQFRSDLNSIFDFSDESVEFDIDMFQQGQRMLDSDIRIYIRKLAESTRIM